MFMFGFTFKGVKSDSNMFGSLEKNWFFLYSYFILDRKIKNTLNNKVQNEDGNGISTSVAVSGLAVFTLVE